MVQFGQLTWFISFTGMGIVCENANFPRQWNWLSVERKKMSAEGKEISGTKRKRAEGARFQFFFRINSHAWFYVVSERDLIIHKAFRMFHTLTFGQYLTQLAFRRILFSAYFDSAEGAAHLSAEGRARLARFDAILQFGQGDGPSPANGHHHVVSPSGTGNTTVYANFSSHWEWTSQCHCWMLLFVGWFCGGSGWGGGLPWLLSFIRVQT